MNTAKSLQSLKIEQKVINTLTIAMDTSIIDPDEETK